MYASWARLSRSAAPRATKSRLATRSDRYFHASVSVRAATDASTPNNAPQDGDDKPAENDGGDAGQETTKDDKLLGDKGLNSNGDARGRQKRFNGSVRSRASRHKTPEELPPIDLPANFHDNHVCRYGDLRKDEQSVVPGGVEQLMSRDAASQFQKTDKQLQQNPNFFEWSNRTLDRVFEAAAWDEGEVQKFQKGTTVDDIETASQRGNVMLIAAWKSVNQAAAVLMVDSPSRIQDFTESLQLLRQFRDTLSQKDREKLLEMSKYYLRRMLPNNMAPEVTLLLLRNILLSKVGYTNGLGLVHHDALLEATSSIRADFVIKPPKNIKVAELKRPITVLNFPYYKGFNWPKHVMQEIATDLGADIVHLTAHDIAHTVGTYLGQDTTRAPGPLSLLGYKAAENAGRVHRRGPERGNEELSPEVAFSIIMQQVRPKKETKKKVSIMDYVLGEPNRGKSDEMWVDLKINAVLEELVHSADSDAAEQRPLIIHVHDINALNMDEECGAVILGKLRKIVDDLWVEGRKVVLVGTCSSADTPVPYRTALKEMRSSERFITLHPAEPEEKTSTSTKDGTASVPANSNPFVKQLDASYRNEVLAENSHNIAAMLQTLLGSGDDSGDAPIKFSLQAMEEKNRPEVLSQKLLPVNRVYRVVKTMIGLRRHDPEVFDQNVLEDSIRLINHIDEEDNRLHTIMDKLDGDLRRNLLSDPGRRSTDYEKKFLSSLVNPDNIKTTFKDIHAPKETIESIKMLTQLSLLRPEAFAYGVLATDRIPGCLLYGPPGTGKTLLAKAVAKESGANMIEVSGATINQMYVGESEKNIKALFSLAKKKEPLVIFIDEADALLGARGGRNDAAGRRDVINQFLREWDGMETSKAFIMVATNRPFDLDEAVLRRLPRKLLIDLPLEADRAEILKIHLKNEALDDTVSIEKMAKQTTLYSGSDLKNVCVAAAMASVKEELEASQKHTGSEPYVWAEKRILNHRHFEKGLSEIPASASEDMTTLSAIKKFDERYGEKKTKRKKRGMGFEVVPEATDSHEARVRSGDK